MVKAKYIQLFTDTWGRIFTIEKSFAKNELYLTLQPKSLSKLSEICSVLVKSLKARFVTLVANDERELHGKFFVYYIFSIAADDLFLILRVPIDPRQHEIPSITASIDAASWFENEMQDWFGIIPFPNISRVAVHPDWPEDIYPMLKEFDAKKNVPRVKGNFDFRHVEGEGVFEIPVGPIHAGIIEPGHFRFSVAGEPIVNLDLQLFYAHKGTEKIAEGMNLHRAVFLAESISGDSSFSHALAYCHAIERLCNVEIPQRALVIRTILLELERIYNHVSDFGSIMLDVGFSVGAQRAYHLKESFMQLNEALVGNRLLRGIAAIGGVRREVEDTLTKRKAIRETVKNGIDTFEQLVNLLHSSSSVLDRLETTGVLSHKDAFRLGVVGIAGRASGIDRDFRRDHPHSAYPFLKFSCSCYDEGDVLARLNVRIEEVRESFRILEQLQNQHNNEAFKISVEKIPSERHALGYVEGWRGEIVHWVMTDTKGNIFRWKITDPSFHNWRALKTAVRNNIVPDFPVINKSFNLSYSGNDR